MDESIKIERQEALDYHQHDKPGKLEVSIGHALVCDSIDFGLKQTIEKYKKITTKK